MKGIGVDVGGTEVKVAVVNKELKVLSNYKIPTPLSNGYKGFVKELGGFIKKIAKEFNATRICFAIAGDVDSERGILRFAPNLNGWRNKRIKSDFELECGVSVDVENDANMAIWGAYVFELKKRYKNVVGFTLGTGVGGGIIIDGKLYRGSSTTAGEFGHMVIRKDGLRCGCGNYGCLEAYTSAKYIVEEAKRRVKGVSANPTPKEIYDLALSGDKEAQRIWYEYGLNLGYGIGNVIVLFNPQAVVLVGGLCGAYRFFKGGIKEALKKYGIKKPIDYAKIIPIARNDLGVIGCAEFVMEKRG